MITASDLYKRMNLEMHEMHKKNPNNPNAKLFIYLDATTYHQILRDLQISKDRFSNSIVWDPEDHTFMGQKVFVVQNTPFHFNIVPML